ncbi:TetR/AcrR family transcriptional regulator [Streptomyces sp. NPDC051954]|uniref:TetR/AcrR family transcriptional regulator n=1 Tax=unclassified Streptomyces TaxID=2593676 RepID=UPI00343D6A46
MVRNTARRDGLAVLATDYVLDHGLIGLSLRPLAAAIGTSDRMLLYHFADKDDLVATVLRISNDRSVQSVRSLPKARSVRTAVLALWQVSTSDASDRCHRVYVEAAALGLLGHEPYVSVVREANERWVEALADHLITAGCTRARAKRAVALLDAAFMGLQLDLPLNPDESHRRRVVNDLADAITALARG